MRDQAEIADLLVVLREHRGRSAAPAFLDAVIGVLTPFVGMLGLPASSDRDEFLRDFRDGVEDALAYVEGKDPTALMAWDLVAKARQEQTCVPDSPTER